MKNDKYYTGGKNNNVPTSALSKIVHLTLITSFSKQIIEEMQRIQKPFMWNNLTLKIKHEISSVNNSSSVLLQPIWYNKNTKINSKPIYAEEFSKQNVIFLYDHFNTENGKIYTHFRAKPL